MLLALQGAGRDTPLLVGSVRSNVGHTGAVSGFAAICKAIVAMETGVIPATINFHTPNAGAAGLTAGRIKVGTVLPVRILIPGPHKQAMSGVSIRSSLIGLTSFLAAELE